MKYQRGEIATVVAIAAFVIMGAATLISAYISQQEKPLTTSTRASEYYGPCKNDPVAPPGGYTWKADCAKTCQKNDDCPQNTSEPNVYAPSSNWCYGGFQGGAKCLQLVSSGGSGETSRGSESSGGSQSSGSGGSCFVGKTCGAGCAGNPGQCADCNGGWCNGGKCSTCGNSGQQSAPSTGGSSGNTGSSTGSSGQTQPQQQAPQQSSCDSHTAPVSGPQPNCSAFTKGTLVRDNSLWKLNCGKTCSSDTDCKEGNTPGWCYGFGDGSKCMTYVSGSQGCKTTEVTAAVAQAPVETTTDTNTSTGGFVDTSGSGNGSQTVEPTTARNTSTPVPTRSSLQRCTGEYNLTTQVRNSDPYNKPSQYTCTKSTANDCWKCVSNSSGESAPAPTNTTAPVATAVPATGPGTPGAPATGACTNKNCPGTSKVQYSFNTLTFYNGPGCRSGEEAVAVMSGTAHTPAKIAEWCVKQPREVTFEAKITVVAYGFTDKFLLAKFCAYEKGFWINKPCQEVAPMQTCKLEGTGNRNCTLQYKINKTQAQLAEKDYKMWLYSPSDKKYLESDYFYIDTRNISDTYVFSMKVQ